MGGLYLPFPHSIEGVRGAAVSTSIPVGGIKSGDTLLAVVEHDGAGPTAGLDPAAFTVSDGAIESATLDTSGSFLALVWS